ncbi:MAG TPA: hypothetical protein VNK96_01135 [Fimbriimonadales bacterium]|nr:hypothetical protein [Fimbriimonadales bacterium]
MEVIEVTAKGPAELKGYLERHPGVHLVEFTVEKEPYIRFERRGWVREVLFGHPEVDGPYGLIEIMDNNPLVCADRTSCPGPAATLALIALNPLIRAGILVEKPSVLFSFEEGLSEVEQALERLGWDKGVTVACRKEELDECIKALVTATIRTPQNPQDIDDLYEEVYGRSFFVREASPGDDLVALTKGKPFAVYTLSLDMEFSSQETAALRSEVVSSIHGKAGCAQMIHMMNVMAGFEEDLGLI